MKPRANRDARITLQLRNEILAGRYAPGVPLREAALSTRFKVARGPVREAFRALQHEGLLYAKPKCGVTVAPVPDEAVVQILTPIRTTLELAALEKCLATRSMHDFGAWPALLRQLHTACAKNDHTAALNIDFAFHEQLFITAGQPSLLPVWWAVVVRLRWYHAQRNRLAAGADTDLLVIHHTHAQLLSLFRTGTAAQASAALSSHMEDGDFNENCRAEYRSVRGIAKRCMEE